MAIKTIKFRPNTDGATSIANGANGVVLATATDGGEYPTTVSGITLGWSPNNDGAISADGLYGAAAPFDFTGVRVAAGGGARLLRIDRAAGTFVIKLQVYMPDGVYASTGLRILDANGTTQLFAQTVATRTTDGVGAPRQINTDGTLVTVGTADAGTTITTTGPQFFVELSGAGSFFTRLTYVEYDDGVGGGGGGIAAGTRVLLNYYS